MVYDLAGGLVDGVEPAVVWDRGICACGHRMRKHQHGRCAGVPTGRKSTHAKVEDNACLCREPRAVVLLADARLFQLSWKVAYPEHPFTVALRRLGEGGIERWMVPVVCENPECGFGDAAVGVRMVYLPGSRRMTSVLACRGCVGTDSAL